MKKYFGPVLVVIVLLALLEVVSRIILSKVYNRSFDSSLIVDNKYLTSAGLKENATGTVWGKLFHTDEFGCRKSPVPYSSKKKKWLFIGDSVTEGVGVDDSSTFAALFAAQNDELNVLNYSLIGYSITDYYNVLQTLLAKHDSSIERATIFFCLNDVYGNTKVKDLPVMAKQNLFGKVNAFLQKHYGIYQLLKLYRYKDSNRYYEYDKQFYKPTNEFFIDAMQCLKRCDSLCKSNDVKLRVVLLPYRYQVLARDTPAHVIKSPDGGEAPIDGNPQYLVKDFCRTNCIWCFDLLPGLRRDVGSSLFLFADEIHFSESGHRLIFEALNRPPPPPPCVGERE